MCLAAQRNDDRDLVAEQLVQQSQSQAVVDPSCPLVHCIEGCRGDQDRIGRWELIGLVR